MRRSQILFSILAAGVMASGAYGDDFVTYDDADRSIEMDCPLMHDVAVANDFDPFDALCQTGNPPAGMGIRASQVSTLEPRTFSATGEAISNTPGLFLPEGWATSKFDVTLTIDETSAFSLNGQMHGRGVYSMTGPGLDIVDMNWGVEKVGDFDVTRITGPGSYTFYVYLVEQTAEGSELPDSAVSTFDLDFLLGPARVADVAGPEGPGRWDGVVDALDMLRVIAEWGDPCAEPCAADITGPDDVPDGRVDALDFLMVIADWG